MTDVALLRVIDELGSIAGIRLAPHEDGLCAIRVDGRCLVHLRQGDEDGELWFFCDLGEPIEQHETWRRVLQANLFWRESAGMTFSLTRDEPPHVVVAERHSWRAEHAASLLEKLERFVAIAMKWLDDLGCRPPS